MPYEPGGDAHFADRSHGQRRGAERVHHRGFSQRPQPSYPTNSLATQSGCSVSSCGEPRLTTLCRLAESPCGAHSPGAMLRTVVGAGMAILEIGNDRIDLFLHVREAVRALGFVRPEAAEWLAGELVSAANKNGGRTIREGGTRFDKAERTAIGLPAWGDHFSREAWVALTEKGRADPVANFDDTCTRAIRGAYEEAQRLRAYRVLRPGGPFAGAKIGPSPAIGLCAAGMAMVGRLLSEPPELPFPGCTRNVCSCSWRLVTKDEAGR